MTTAYLKDGGATAHWLTSLRQRGLERFRETGYPTSREEDWRFVNLTPLTGQSFRAVQSDGTAPRHSLGAYLFPIRGGHTLVFLNGQYVPALSAVQALPRGVTVRNLADAASAHGELIREHLGRYARVENSGFTALNTASLHDGLFVHVPAGVEVEGPIHALFVSDARAAGAASHPRTLVVVERGARAAVIESHVGLDEANYFTNAVTEAVVGDDARFEHVKIQREAERAFHVGTTHLELGRGSHGVSHSVSLGAALCRNNLDVVLAGPGIEAQMFGLYMGRGTQEVDNHTSLLHAHPNCSTREVYKGILDGQAHGVFNGKIYVTPIAQKTDAKQTNRALLLSDRATVDTKPQLEIFADDVKCTHGATVGNLDQVAAFYLKSRGIGGSLARRILTYAFAAEVLEEIPYEPVRAALEGLVMSRLEERGES